MVRFSIRAVVLVAVLFCPVLVAAQGIPSFFANTPFSLDGVKCSVAAKAGYQQMAVNFNLPMPFTGLFGPALYASSTLDFKLQGAGVWIGGIEANAQRGPISAFLGVEANARKNVGVLTSSDPFWSGEYPVEWKGSQFQWWAIDGGAGLDTPALTIVGGLRVEHLSLKLEGPVDSDGLIQYYQATFGDRYRGDFLNILWLPYVGIRTQGHCWRGTLRLSPVAWTDLTIPARYFYVDSPALRFFEQARYTFKRNGIWLDGSVDYDVHTSSNCRCSFWFRANWLRIRGDGSEGYQLDGYFAGLTAQLLTDSNSGTGMYTSYNFGGGVRAEYLF